jgi:chromosome segregation ATPase
VFTIQSVMLVSLGFLLAVLLGFVIAPAYWARAVRLTTERIRRALPMTEAEIRAQLDRLRAEHAVRVHRLETQFEKARLSAARQRVEINRRDAAISDLERQVKELDTNLEASSNARRVLEQTISDRVPKIEARLLETRSLLEARDAEINEIRSASSKTYHSLDEAMQINAQQRNEIDRLRNTLATRTASEKTGPATARFESEIALRSELEELRARARDQASLIDSLQKAAAPTGQADRGKSTAAQPEGERPTGGDASDKAGATIIHLNDVDKSGESARSFPTADSLNAEIETLKNANRRQSDEIEKLKAALSVFETEAEEAAKSSLGSGLRDSKVALRARLSSADKETEQQAQTIKRLKAELAAANDRLAQQASRHREELRRLGSGTVPTTARPRGDGISASPPHRDQNSDDKQKKRASLASRIIEKLPETATELGGSATAVSKPTATSASTDKAMQAKSKTGEDANNDVPAGSESASEAKAAEHLEPSSGSDDKPDRKKATDKTREKPTGDDPKPQRSRLMDRIAGLGKS